MINRQNFQRNFLPRVNSLMGCPVISTVVFHNFLTGSNFRISSFSGHILSMMPGTQDFDPEETELCCIVPNFE